KRRAIACWVRCKGADGDAESGEDEDANGVSIGATSLSETGSSHLPLWLTRSAASVISSVDGLERSRREVRRDSIWKRAENCSRFARGVKGSIRSLPRRLRAGSVRTVNAMFKSGAVLRIADAGQALPIYIDREGPDSFSHISVRREKRGGTFVCGRA